MKKLVGVLALVVAGASCQSHMAPDKALVKVKAGVAAQATSPVAADTLPIAMLSAYDLSPVLRTRSAAPDDIVEPMNGFLGTDHYRIELVVTDVERDPQQPTRYLLRGKDRYKGRVIPFVGTIELTQVQRQPDSIRGTLKAAYTAVGRFKLKEATTQPAVGTFQGRVAVDWAIAEDNKLMQYTLNVRIPHSHGLIREFEPSTKTPTLGGGILYDGTWTSAAGQVKPAVWAADLLAYHGPQILSDFVVGGRMLNVNPKYAKLGWNEYWQNDEWWADSNVPKLSL